MSVVSALFRRIFRISRGGKAGWFEPLEGRCLLSASATIPASVVGPIFSGTAQLRYHAAKGIHAHSSTAPVTLDFSSFSNGTLEGSISAQANGQVDFSGPTDRRSFAGVFTDGMIIGTFGVKGHTVHGAVRETVNGELITGHFSARIPSATPATRHHDQSSTASGYSGPTMAATSGTATTSTPTASSTLPVPTEPISLPALETSFTTPYALNATTTASGVDAGISSLSGSLASQPPVSAGTGTATAASLNVVSSTSALSSNATYVFSTSSGIVSITNSGEAFTASSGIVSITAPPTFTPSSGIVSVGVPGM